MARVTVTSSSGSSKSQSHSEGKSRSQSRSESVTKKELDEALLSQILAGLTQGMTDEEIDAFARNLLEPERNAQIEASRQQYETAKQRGEQEIEDLAAALTRQIDDQRASYRQSMADVETAALARGMGRSSYTLETLAKQGDALAEAVLRLTEESERKRAQVGGQITLAAQQDAQTQGRINEDYAASVRAKAEAMRREQRQEQNRNYLTAISAAMGQRTSGTQETEGSQTTDTTGSSESHSTSISSSGGGGSGRKAKKEEEEEKKTPQKVIHGRYSPGNTSKIR